MGSTCAATDSASTSSARFRISKLTSAPSPSEVLAPSGSGVTDRGSGATARDGPPDPARRHVPPVEHVLADGVDEEGGVEQSPRGRGADQQQLVVGGQAEVVGRGEVELGAAHDQ